MELLRWMAGTGWTLCRVDLVELNDEMEGLFLSFFFCGWCVKYFLLKFENMRREAMTRCEREAVAGIIESKSSSKK